MAAEKDKKVMDVASPEEAKTDIGSKPMIVGHKSMASDPMVREEEVEKTSEEASEASASPEKQDEPKLVPPSAKQKTIVPLKDQEKEETSEESKEAASTSTEEVNDKPAPKEATAEKEPTPEKDSKIAESDDESKDDDKKDEKKIDPTAEAMEREEKLRKIIDSKKYNVNIKQAHGSRKGLVWALIGLLIAGLLGLFVAIDTGNLDLGFKLPFTIFGEKDESVQQNVDSNTVPVTPNNQTVETQTALLQDSTKSFSVEYPKSWKLLDYVWEDCCEGETKTEPDWTKITQPITLNPEPEENKITVQIEAVNDGSITLEDLKANQTDDQFNFYEEQVIGDYTAYYHKLDFVGPSDAEKYLVHTYYVINGKETVTFSFRERYSNTTTDGESDFDGAAYVVDFIKLVKSIKFL
ncbi:hypothetical protein KC992_03145 [Candidatus Saccharibacteria bacterium]|nr:hypothetical protein [Candidatus Saccharibacteria bacterium]